MALERTGVVRINAKQTGLANMTKMSAGLTQSLGGLRNIVGTGLGLVGLGALISKTISIGRTYNDWIGNNAQAIEGMRKATKGLIGDLDLAAAQTQLTTGDFALTEKQLAAVSKAAVVYSRINKTELKTSLDAIVKSIRGGSDMALRKLGMNIELLGSKSQKSQDAIDALTGKFSDVAIEAENVNEQMAQVTSGLESATGQFMNSLLASNTFKGALENLATTVKWLSGLFDKLHIASASGTGTMIGRLVSQRENLGWIPGTEKAQAILTARIKSLEELRKLQVGVEGDREFLEEFEAEGKASREKFEAELAALRKNKKGKGKGKRSGGAGTRDMGSMSLEDTDVEGWLQTGNFSGVSEEDFGLAGVSPDFQQTNLGDAEKIFGMQEALGELGISILDVNGKLKSMGQISGEVTSKMKAEFDSAVSDLTKGALSDIGGMVLDLGAQLAESGTISAKGVIDFLRNMLMGISKTLLGKGIAASFEASALAATPLTAWLAPFFSAQAGLYYAGAAAVGTAAVGLSAVSGAMSRGSSASAGGARGGGGSSRASGQYNFGETRKDDKRPLIVQVYFGEKGDPAARLYATQALEAVART